MSKHQEGQSRPLDLQKKLSPPPDRRNLLVILEQRFRLRKQVPEIPADNGYGVRPLPRSKDPKLNEPRSKGVFEARRPKI
jgi:hypothetical protein